MKPTKQKGYFKISKKGLCTLCENSVKHPLSLRFLAKQRLLHLVNVESFKDVQKYSPFKQITEDEVNEFWAKELKKKKYNTVGLSGRKAIEFLENYSK